MPPSRLLRRVRFARACWWLALGIAILPLKSRSKHLQPGFGPHQASITDRDHAHHWLLGTDANLGVVLGGPAGLVVADWDDASAYRAWTASVGGSIRSLIEKTARGYHVFFLAETRLPSAADSACEFKTSGACAVAPSIHPSGTRYSVIYPGPITTLDSGTARSLFPFLSAIPHPKPSSDSNKPPLSLPQTGLVARIKSTRPIVDEARDAGIHLRPAGHDTLIGRCPFHDDHTPSLWVYPDKGLWGCNRPDCPAAGTHDVINFRARWRSISNRAAIRQLADEYL